MAILAECPVCHTKQAKKNKKCIGWLDKKSGLKCNENLDDAKKAKKVKYWISYRMPDGKQRRESVAAMEDLDPYSITDARTAESKRMVQKKENRIMDMLPESNMTFLELSDWYTGLRTVKKLASYERVTIALNNFNAVFGNRIAGTVLPVELEDYQEKRLEDGLAPTTLDVELAIVKGMINKAFDNDKIGGRVLKAFRKVKNKCKRGANARKRTITLAEYLKLLADAPKHLKPMLIVAMNTGMRPGELRKLSWKHIDCKAGFIRLPAEVTKEGKEKIIPINHHVETVLDDLKPPLGIVTEGHHDFVFTFGGKPISSPGGVKGALRATCKNAGVSYGRKVPNGIIMHDFRRTVKTNMTNAAVNGVYRDLILGHSLQGMDVHYISPSNEDLKQAMGKYTVWLDRQLETLSQNVDHSVDQAQI